ncbi:hypothetical protein B7486_60815, partial [cyanobacterium TDX16]
LASVETLGSTTVICSDKTGTLTMNEMAVRHLVLDGEVHDLGPGAPDLPLEDDAVRTVLEHAALCSDARLIPPSAPGADDGGLVGDPTEGALLVLASERGLDVDTLRRAHPRLGEVPFDSAAKRMATFHAEDGAVRELVKGAPDVVLDLVDSVVDHGDEVPLDDDRRRQWQEANDALAAQGIRVLAVASRQLPSDVLGADGAVEDPEAWTDGLVLEGLVGLVDPPRPEARDAIAHCRAAGIDVKMITGDHAATAGAIAQQLGIRGEVRRGVDLDALSDEQLADEVEQVGVFARVSPEHKVRVVQALRSRGHVVAMTGDGVNDAAALRHADIGVAMGITGTEVTKEAADLVLAD